MAVAAVIGSPSGAINYTFTTDSIGDWASVANGTYFYDKADKLVHFKDDSGAILELFTASGGGNGVGIHAPLVVSGRSVTYMVVANLSFASSATSSLRIYAMPFIPMVSFTTASFYINCVTPQTGAIARILIYSELNTSPDTKLYESTDIDLSTSGIKTITASFSFSANTTYFICVHGQGTASISFIAAPYMLPIGFNNTSAAFTYFYPTTTFAIGSAPIVFGDATLGNGNAPYVGIIAA